MQRLRHKPLGLNKSWLITIISIIQSYGVSIFTLVIPLYLFAVFKSEYAVGAIASTVAFGGILLTLFLGFILTHYERHHIFKVALIIGVIGIVLFMFVQDYGDAKIAGTLSRTTKVIIPAILSLYLRDLTTKRDLPHMQGIFSSLINFAWLTGPIIAGYLITYFDSTRDFYMTLPFFNSFDPEYFQYTMPFVISIGLHLISLLIFIWGKFVISHPHLQDAEMSKKTDKRLHVRYIANLFEYFQDSKRALSFYNLSFIAIWWVFIFTFLAILLKKHGISPHHIGIVLGLISLPTVLLEGFLDKFMKKVGGSLNALIIGYLIFGGFVAAAFVVGYENIYLFITLIILSQIGVAMTEPLQEFMFFEGTDKVNENRFYAIHSLGFSLMTFLSPVVVGYGISIYGIDKTFYALPYLFLFILLILAMFKISEKKG